MRLGTRDARKVLPGITVVLCSSDSDGPTILLRVEDLQVRDSADVPRVARLNERVFQGEPCVAPPNHLLRIVGRLNFLAP